MSERLPSGVLVGALLRRVNDAGGLGTVLAKGDAQGGAILIVTSERGADFRILERGIAGLDGSGLVTCFESAGSDSRPVSNYWQKRRRHDPDMWVIELDSPDAERFAAETIGTT